MGKYKVLVIVYLVSVLASSLANFLKIDVQTFLRVPLLNLRWIDFAIILIVSHYFYNAGSRSKLITGNSTLIFFCFALLLFDTSNLIITWGQTESNWQIAGFICMLCLFALIDLSTFEFKKEGIVSFLQNFGLYGSIALIIANSYLFYSFITGNIVIEDNDLRVAIEVAGSKEVVSTVVLIPFVYLFSLYKLKMEKVRWKKWVYIIAVLSIYLSLVYSFHRGYLVTIILLTVIYLIVFTNKIRQTLSAVAGLIMFVGLIYLLFGNTLKDKGYDPIEKITEIVAFAADVDNPDWDKGRNIPQDFAIAVWKKHFWMGAGYNDFFHFGYLYPAPMAHNFVITSLFHRGVIGTFLYLLILILLFRNGYRLWFILKHEPKHDYYIFKVLIIVSFFWLIPFLTQEIIWEKYSLSIQFMYLGIITNIYRQYTIKAKGPSLITSKNAFLIKA